MKKIDNSTATETNLFTDGDPAVPTPATTLPAWYMNMLQVELVKLVEMAGITLDTAEEGDALNNQIAQAMAVHVSGLNFYADSGAADAYVLSAIGADEAENTVPPAYFDGMLVRFVPDNSGTGGAATVNVAALGVKSIKTGAGAGANPASNALTAGVPVTLHFDAANDCFKTTAFTAPDATETVKGIVEKAIQSEMEAETADKYPDAAIFKHHPGVAKARCTFSGTGTPTPLSAYNVTSITDNGTGDYTVNFTNNFANSYYASMVTVRRNSTGSPGVQHTCTNSVGSCNIETFGNGTASNTNTDSEFVSFTAHGELA